MNLKMGLHQGLYLKQQLVMTQRLQQALKLLQVPTLELEQILRQELQNNPLLEEVDPNEDSEDESPAEERASQETATNETPAATDEPVDWDEYFKDGFRGAAHEQEFEDDDQLERPTVYVPSGQQDLEEQLNLVVVDEMERKIGEYIIGCLNEQGFLACSIDEVVAYFDVDIEIVQKVLKTIQSFDPPGVGAADLQECLLLQLKFKGLEDSQEAHVITHHFQALKTRKFGA